MNDEREEEEFKSHRCIACGGAAHPASGMELPSGKVICGPCVRDFHDWITKHSKKSYRVGPKGSKSSKYIPFPTGIVREETMKLAAFLEYLKEEDGQPINKFIDLSDGIKWRAAQAAATPDDSSLHRREGWLKSIKPIALELVGLIDQIAESSLEEQDIYEMGELKKEETMKLETLLEYLKNEEKTVRECGPGRGEAGMVVAEEPQDGLARHVARHQRVLDIHAQAINDIQDRLKRLEPDAREGGPYELEEDNPSGFEDSMGIVDKNRKAIEAYAERMTPKQAQQLASEPGAAESIFSQITKGQKLPPPEKHRFIQLVADAASGTTQPFEQGGSSLREKAPPGMEDTVMKLKKQYPNDPAKPYAVAWSIYNRNQGKEDVTETFPRKNITKGATADEIIRGIGATKADIKAVNRLLANAEKRGEDVGKGPRPPQKKKKK